MISSLKIYPNEFKGGDWCALYPEGFDKPDQVIDKPCVVKLFEMDTKSNSQEKPGSKDLLATFESVIRRSNTTKLYYFDPDNTRRTDTFKHTSPSEETRTGADGKPLPVPLKFKPAHFLFALHFGGQRPVNSDLHYISLAGNSNEAEGMMYEVSFSLEIGGKEILHSYKFQTFIDCSNILAENCASAAMFFKQNHDNKAVTDGVGTYFGNKFFYSFKDETSALEDYSRISNRGRVDPAWVQANRGSWLDAEKKKFDNFLLSNKLQKTSCIDFVQSVLSLAFDKSGMGGDWNRIWGYFKDKDGVGQHLAKTLIDNGWVALYYNSDTKNPYDGNNEHSETFREVTKHWTYGSKNGKPYIPPVVPVHDVVVDYAPTKKYADGTVPKIITNANTLQIRKLLKIPFAFLMSKWSIHTAMLISGKVYEVHWDVGPYPPKSGSEHLFSNKRDFIYAGAHLSNADEISWEWVHGLVVLPKSYWPTRTYKQ